MLIERLGEGVVHTRPSRVVLVPLECREVDDPYKGKASSRNDVALSGDMLAKLAKPSMDVGLWTCGHEHHIADLDIGNHGAVLLLDLGEWTSPAIGRDLAPEQATEAIPLHKLGPAVQDFTARALDRSLDDHGLDNAASLDGTSDHPELGARPVQRGVLHSEAHVRRVTTEAVHGLVVRDRGNLADLNTDDL